MISSCDGADGATPSSGKIFTSAQYRTELTIAALMKLLNQCARAMRQGASDAVAAEAVATLASLLQPFAPHLAAEVFYQLTGERVWTVPWPVAAATPIPAGTPNPMPA